MNDKLKEQQQIIQQVQAEAKLHHQQMRLKEQQNQMQKSMMNHQQEIQKSVSKEHIPKQMQENDCSQSPNESFNSSKQEASFESDKSPERDIRDESHAGLQQKHKNDLEQMILHEQQHVRHQQLEQLHQQKIQEENNLLQREKLDSQISNDTALTLKSKTNQPSAYLETVKEDIKVPDENGNTPDEDKVSLDKKWIGANKVLHSPTEPQYHFQQQRIRSFEEKLCRGELPPSSPIVRNYPRETYDHVSDSPNASEKLANSGILPNSHTEPNMRALQTSAASSIVGNGNNSTSEATVNQAGISSPIATSSPHILPASFANGSLSSNSSPHGGYASHSLGASPHAVGPRSIMHSRNSTFSSKHPHTVINYANSNNHGNSHANHSQGADVTSLSSSTLNLMKKQITEIEREIALRKPDGSCAYSMNGSVPYSPNVTGTYSSNGSGVYASNGTGAYGVNGTAAYNPSSSGSYTANCTATYAERRAEENSAMNPPPPLDLQLLDPLSKCPAS